MKKRIKNWKKKLFLGVGSVLPLGTLTAAVISCAPLLGSLNKYDSDTDNLVVIQTTWSASGKQKAALEKVVKKYNELEKGKAGYMRVEVQKVEGGYGTVPSQILTKIQSQDKKTLPNMYIDYPSAVGVVSPYGMVLDVSDQTNPDGLSRDLFEEMFVSVNDRIAGLPKNGIYSVPLAKSTEGVTFDKVLLKYIFEEMSSKGKFTIKADANNPTIKSIMDVKIEKIDSDFIKETWKELDPSKIVAGENNFINGNRDGSATDVNNEKIIDESIFESYTSLFTFASAVQKLFPDAEGVKLMGLDSSSNLIYNLSSLAQKNNPDEFLFTKNDQTNDIDYNFLDKGSTQSNTFRNVYKDFVEKLINNDAIWIGGGGTYGSQLLTPHKMAISIGSSAGLDKSFNKSSGNTKEMNSTEVGYHSPIDKIYTNNNKPVDSEYDWDKVSSVVAQGPSINTMHISPEENKATIRFLKWLYNDKRYDWGDGQETKTPTQSFASDSSYIVPTKGAFSDDSVIAKKINNQSFDELLKVKDKWSLLGLKMSFETLGNQLKKNKTNKLAQIFDVPVGIDTGAIRKMIDAKIKASSNSRDTGSNAYSPIRVWNDLRDSAIIDGVIPGTVNKKTYDYPNQLNRNFSNIDWNDYNYVDATIDEWTDGDTVKVTINSVHSKTRALDNIKPGQKYPIRISGIDTPEAHVKLGDIKHFEKDADGNRISSTMDIEFMKKIIDKYKRIGTPLATFSWVSSGNGFYSYNKLNYDYDPLKPITDKKNKNKRYGFWENVHVDIQTPNLTKPFEGYDKLLDPNDPESLTDLVTREQEDNFNTKTKPYIDANSIYNLRTVEYNGKRILSPAALIEGYWGWRAGDFARHVIPKGTPIRIATDGKKSYNRLVGSIFFDKDNERAMQRKKNKLEQVLNSNFSVEITKAGLTLPFITNMGAILEPNNILWENGPGIADAFNYALARPLQSDRSGNVLYDYRSTHPDDPNNNQTLLSYKGQYIVKIGENGTYSFNPNYSASSLDEWLAKALITHGSTDYSGLLRNSGNSSSLYNYLRYRNPNKQALEGSN